MCCQSVFGLNGTIHGRIHECSSDLLSSLMFVVCRTSNVLLLAGLIAGGIRGMELHCRYAVSTCYRLYFVAGKYTVPSSYLPTTLSMFSNL